MNKKIIIQPDLAADMHNIIIYLHVQLNPVMLPGSLVILFNSFSGF